MCLFRATTGCPLSHSYVSIATMPFVWMVSPGKVPNTIKSLFAVLVSIWGQNLETRKNSHICFQDEGRTWPEEWKIFSHKYENVLYSCLEGRIQKSRDHMLQALKQESAGSFHRDSGEQPPPRLWGVSQSPEGVTEGTSPHRFWNVTDLSPQPGLPFFYCRGQGSFQDSITPTPHVRGMTEPVPLLSASCSCTQSLWGDCLCPGSLRYNREYTSEHMPRTVFASFVIGTYYQGGQHCR